MTTAYVFLFVSAFTSGYFFGVYFSNREKSKHIKNYEKKLEQVRLEAEERLRKLHESDEEYMQNMREEVSELVAMSLLAEEPIPSREDYN